MSQNKLLENLLEKVSIISKKYEDIAKITGENFNIFSVMNMEWDEVNTHSAIIGELLNPEGSHNFGRKFLDSFLEILNKKFEIKINPFEKLINERICERTITFSNDWNNVTGGRIDIIIEDNQQILLIENKPSAKDQDFQLIRYYNYAKLRNKKFFIVYLTLDEKIMGDEKEYENEFNQKITGKNFPYSKKEDYEKYKIENNNPNNHYCLYYPISFKYEVLEWIEKCIEISKNIPLICETLKQYRNNIKNITNQNTNIQMDNEIKRLITIDNVESIQLLNQQINEIIHNTKNKFTNLFNQKFDLNSFTLNDGSEITPNYDDEDEDGFFLGLQFYNNRQPLNNSEKGRTFTNQLKQKFSNLELHPNESFIIWYNPMPFLRTQKFENIDIKEIIKMYNNEGYLIKIVDEIIHEFNTIKDYLKTIT